MIGAPMGTQPYRARNERMDVHRGVESDETAGALAAWLKLDGRVLAPSAVVILRECGMELPPANDGLWGEM